MLPGIIIKPLKRMSDERAPSRKFIEKTGKTFSRNDVPAQANFSVTYPGIIRAWHRHLRGQTDYFFALKGAVKICAYDDKTSELAEVISAEQNLQAVRMPGNYWHGFKAVAMNQPSCSISPLTSMNTQNQTKNADLGMTRHSSPNQ